MKAVRIFFLTVLNALMMALGQILWKTGMSNKEVNTFGEILQAIFSPLIFCGLIVYGLATFLWLYILSKAEISYVYPIQSLAFVLVLISSMVLFKEQVALNRWIGVGVICFGVYIVSIK